MADVSVQNERNDGWIPSSATNVILNWPERIKTQPHDDRDNCFQHFDSKGSCGMTVNNDIDDDSATKHSDSHSCRRCTWRALAPPRRRNSVGPITPNHKSRGCTTTPETQMVCLYQSESTTSQLLYRPPNHRAVSDCVRFLRSSPRTSFFP